MEKKLYVCGSNVSPKKTQGKYQPLIANNTRHCAEQNKEYKYTRRNQGEKKQQQQLYVHTFIELNM